MTVLGIDIPSAFLSGGGVGTFVVLLMIIYRQRSEDAKAAVGGFTALSGSQVKFIDRLQADVDSHRQLLDDCKQQHAECEARCAGLEQRVARLEVAVEQGAPPRAE